VTNDEGIKGKGRHLLIDKKKCQGCMTCMLACSLVHEGKENLSLSRIQVIQSSFEKYPLDIETRYVESCDLCVETPFWDEQGGVDGKQACVEACPLGAVRLSTEISTNLEDGGCEVNFRGKGWKKIGYPID
jgi:protein NrfC